MCWFINISPSSSTTVLDTFGNNCIYFTAFFVSLYCNWDQSAFHLTYVSDVCVCGRTGSDVESVTALLRQQRRWEVDLEASTGCHCCRFSVYQLPFSSCFAVETSFCSVRVLVCVSRIVGSSSRLAWWYDRVSFLSAPTHPRAHQMEHLAIYPSNMWENEFCSLT